MCSYLEENWREFRVQKWPQFADPRCVCSVNITTVKRIYIVWKLLELNIVLNSDENASSLSSVGDKSLGGYCNPTLIFGKEEHDISRKLVKIFFFNLEARFDRNVFVEICEVLPTNTATSCPVPPGPPREASVIRAKKFHTDDVILPRIQLATLLHFLHTYQLIFVWVIWRTVLSVK